jgi:hypothetical protein
MKRRQDQVAGQRCLDRDLGGFEVSILTDEDDVWDPGEGMNEATPAKFRPICSFICTWLIPGRLNSTGSSAVIMFVSG